MLYVALTMNEKENTVNPFASTIMYGTFARTQHILSAILFCHLHYIPLLSYHRIPMQSSIVRTIESE